MAGEVSWKPQFLQVLLPASIEKLLIPPDFNKHIIKEKLSMVTILSPLGSSWLLHVQKESQCYYFNKGWREFVESHNLAVGHIVTFCYHGSKIFSFSAFGFSAYQIQFNPTSDQKCEEDMKPRLKKKKSCKNASKNGKHVKSRYSYTKVIKFHHLNCGQMGLSKEFCNLADLSSRCNIRLMDDKGRLSIVNLVRTGTGELRLGKGWGEFAWRNKLKEGDECVFELESKGKEVTLKVQILKK